jgi:hypothetical protein
VADIWTVRAAREFLGDWRQNDNAAKARAHLAAALDALDGLRAAWNAHMETCPPAGRPEIAQASWDDLERWRNAPSGTASVWDAEQEADHAD